MRILIPVAMALMLIGCATSGKINAVQLDMTKAEVIAVMGEPVSVSAQGGAEYLNYKLSETDDDAYYGITSPYYVRLIDGKVESYGRTDENVKVEEDSDLYTELRKLKQLRENVAASNGSGLEAELLKAVVASSDEMD